MKMIYRLISLISVLACVSFITFLLYYFTPGDKALAVANARYMGEGNATAAVIQEIRLEMGLNDPFLQQYGHWLWQICQGDFGVSLVSQESVWLIFLENLTETLSLTFAALIFGGVIAFMLGIICYWRTGFWIDRIVVMLSSIGAAMPSYWLALLLILLFAVEWQLLPAYGTGSLSHLILPALTLSFWVITSQTRMLRSFFLRTKYAPFIDALRLRHVSEVEIFWKHILHHALIPALTLLAMDLAFLLEGAVIIEVLFSRAGVGSLLVSSVMSRDYPIVLFLVLFSAYTYVLLNNLTEILQDWIDPRTN